MCLCLCSRVHFVAVKQWHGGYYASHMYASCTSFCRLRVCMYERQLYVNNLISLLVKFIKHNQNYYLKTLRFDLYQRPSSEEAGTEFFLFLTQREDAVSRKVVCVAQLVAAIITVHGPWWGQLPLSHAYDHFLDTASSRCVKNRKNWVPASSDEGLW